MSPGFTPRPSLSERRPCPARQPRAGVAGVHAPAFVERLCCHPRLNRAEWVSPGFTPRPSLSGKKRDQGLTRPEVSPGFTPRPSLSGRPRGAGWEARRDVSPGFTPRPSLSGGRRQDDAGVHSRVAGVHAPAFVERPSPHRRSWPSQVSPGFTPRPSLSERSCGRRDGRHPAVSPGFTPRPSLSAAPPAPKPPACPGVAGVHAPAFVERGSAATHASPSAACRRGSRPGLR